MGDPWNQCAFVTLFNGRDRLSFKIDSLDDLRKIMVMARGGDPNAQQTLNDFLKFDSDIERTNLPTRRDVQLMVFADYAGKTLYPNSQNDPFSRLAQSIAIAFMAKGGEKSKQFVDLMKQTPSLTDLQTVQESTNASLIDRFLKRSDPK